MITFIKSSISHPGGLEKAAIAIMKELCLSGAPVTLLTTEMQDLPFHHPLLSIVSFPIWKPLSVVKILHFDHLCQQYLKTHPTPIVFSLDRNRYQTHIRAGNGVYPAFLASRANHESFWKRASFSINPLHRTILTMEKRAFEHPDLQQLFVNSHQVERDVLHYYHVEPSKICVVHNGVAWKELESHFNAWETLRPQQAKKWGLDPHCYQILFLGHNFRRKGLDRLLRGLAHLNDKNVQLSVVGHDKKTPLYQQLAERLGLKGRVFFFGPLRETVAFFQIADLLAIPSYYDPFANVTVEALGMGVPVLSSKENGGHEILEEHMGQTLENADDVECVAQALRKAMHTPKTADRADRIRKSIAHLDFGIQLKKITEEILIKIN